MVTYEQWNKAIISYFFENNEDLDEIVFLQTDANTLLDIARQSNFNVANADEAANSLTEVVRKKVVYNGLVDFWKISPAKVFWQQDDSEQKPSQVAFLALTVLAASLMDKSNEASQTNYYVQLHRLLHGKPNHGIPKGIKYKEWEELWKHLQKWARNRFKIKLYLTEGSPKKKYVWYPISQCLISKYDEHILHGIFKEMDLKPGAYLAESQLRAILLSCQSFPKLSIKIRRPIREKKTAETRLILGQIQLLLENWDGETTERVSRGIKRQNPNRVNVQIRFNTSGDINEVRYWFRCKRDSEITFQCNDLGIEILQPLDEQWFRPFVMRVNSLSLQVLQDGVELKSEEIKPLTFRLKSSEIWIFRHDSEPDEGWFNKGNLLLHEEHRIVYRKQLKRSLITFLQQICNDELIPKSIYIADQETEWQYMKIRPTTLCDSSFLGFRVTTSNQIRFVGGLPLDRRSNSYFDFCLPTIVVPNLIDLPGKSFCINGQATKIPNDRKIELSGKPDRSEYQFSYLDCQATLRVISPIRSSDHEKQTLATNMDLNSNALPIFIDRQVAEISDESGVYLTGAKFLGTDIPEVSWEDMEKIPEPPPTDPSFKTPANIISSVVQVAIDLRRGNASVPEWLDEVIAYLDQNPAVRALVEKKLNRYYETALSYTELRKQIGR